MNDPWIWGTLWELTVAGQNEQRRKKGENWGMCNTITIKMILKRIKVHKTLHHLCIYFMTFFNIFLTKN